MNTSLPREVVAEIERTRTLVAGVLDWLQFCYADTARDSEFRSSHLLSFLDQDVVETLCGILANIEAGIHLPAIRECSAFAGTIA